MGLRRTGRILKNTARRQPVAAAVIAGSIAASVPLGGAALYLHETSKPIQRVNESRERQDTFSQGRYTMQAFAPELHKGLKKAGLHDELEAVARESGTDPFTVAYVLSHMGELEKINPKDPNPRSVSPSEWLGAASRKMRTRQLQMARESPDIETPGLRVSKQYKSVLDAAGRMLQDRQTRAGTNSLIAHLRGLNANEIHSIYSAEMNPAARKHRFAPPDASDLKEWKSLSKPPKKIELDNPIGRLSPRGKPLFRPGQVEARLAALRPGKALPTKQNRQPMRRGRA